MAFIQHLIQHEGYATITGPGGHVKEFSTYTCSHCGSVRCYRTSSPDTTVDLGGHCRICDSNICTPCVERAQVEGCIPFAKKLEEYERREALRRACEDA